jgi:hypothetical protein
MAPLGPFPDKAETPFLFAESGIAGPEGGGISRLKPEVCGFLHVLRVVKI